MELYFGRPQEHERFYNCSFYNVDDIPAEKRTHTSVGFSILFTAIIYEILYIPCLISISTHLNNSAYKFMFYIGIVDMFCMNINGVLTGYFAMRGFVFCSHPTFIYFVGAMGDALWVTETCAAMMLAINRCVEMWSSKMAYTLYKGRRTWLWLLFPIIYAIIIFIFTPPLMFSGIYVSWFFNPHVGYYDDFGKIYYNDLHTVHNAFVLLGLTGIYVLFIILLAIKSSTFEGYTPTRSRSQRRSFFQVLLISLVNATAAAIYVYMQFARISDVFIIIGSFAWLNAHGLPSVIYITMNRTIRNDCCRMFNSLGFGNRARVNAVKITTTGESGTHNRTQSEGDHHDEFVL